MQMNCLHAILMLVCQRLRTDKKIWMFLFLPENYTLLSSCWNNLLMQFKLDVSKAQAVQAAGVSWPHY